MRGYQWQFAGSIWSFCFLLLFSHSGWDRRFIFLFLVLVILLAAPRTGGRWVKVRVVAMVLGAALRNPNVDEGQDL